jgi:hypothetical protein
MKPPVDVDVEMDRFNKKPVPTKAPTVGKIHQWRANQLFVPGLPMYGFVLPRVVQLLSTLSGSVRLCGGT